MLGGPQRAREFTHETEVCVVEREYCLGAQPFGDGDDGRIDETKISVCVLRIERDRAGEDVVIDRLGDVGTRLEVV